jgi:molybdate/tungstate transport system substrate-binding protein
MRRIRRGIIALLLTGAIILSGCSGTSTKKSTLVVLEADSLMVPFAQIQTAFEQANPDINVELQPYGSIQAIRQVTELGQQADLVAVADETLVPMMMYQTKMGNGQPYAGWDIESNTNQLVLAYTATSKYADEINSSNWYQIISRPDVAFGLTDPRIDAVGYRTLMTLGLAATYYDDPTLVQDAVGNHFSMPITADTVNGTTTVSVPELLEPTDSHLVLRNADMELLALLQSGNVDYTIDYKSVVMQDGLKYLELPPEINLGDISEAQAYQKVTVNMNYQRFATVNPVFGGTPIIYGMTIPNNAQNPSDAIKFIQFVLGTKGQEIFNNCSQPEMVPPICDNVSALPNALKTLFH